MSGRCADRLGGAVDGRRPTGCCGQALDRQLLPYGQVEELERKEGSSGCAFYADHLVPHGRSSGAADAQGALNGRPRASRQLANAIKAAFVEMISWRPRPVGRRGSWSHKMDAALGRASQVLHGGWVRAPPNRQGVAGDERHLLQGMSRCEMSLLGCI